MTSSNFHNYPSVLLKVMSHIYNFLVRVCILTHHFLVHSTSSSWYDAVNWNLEASFPTRCNRFHTLILTSSETKRIQNTGTKQRQQTFILNKDSKLFYSGYCILLRALMDIFLIWIPISFVDRVAHKW
jgi:hypothetical protein